MVIGDYFTKWKVAFALQDHTAYCVADVLINEIICRYCTTRRIEIYFQNSVQGYTCRCLQDPHHPISTAVGWDCGTT